MSLYNFQLLISSLQKSLKLSQKQVAVLLRYKIKAEMAFSELGNEVEFDVDDFRQGMKHFDDKFYAELGVKKEVFIPVFEKIFAKYFAHVRSTDF